MSEALEKTLRYPVFWIGQKDRPIFSSYDLVQKQTGFHTTSRLPKTNRFLVGKVFDSSGAVFDYAGDAAPVTFSGASKTILEHLIIPPIISKLVEAFVYCGPKLTSRRETELADFKVELMSAMSVYRDKDYPQLKRLVDEASSFQDCLEKVDWWRYHGGKRDEDGHPEDSPEYSGD